MPRTHNICWACWRSRHTVANEEGCIVEIPIRLTESPDAGGSIIDLEDACCYCGHLNIEGIYVRDTSGNTACGGIHKS